MRKIHQTLGDDKEAFADTKILLDAHFKPKLNLTFERNKFHMAHQQENETISAFVTRLKYLSKTCDFGNYSTDNAILDQVISKCTSNNLRRRLLNQ